DRDAAKTVCHQYDRAGRGLYGIVESFDPVVASRREPVVLLQQAAAGCAAPPVLLPVIRAGTMPAGNQNLCCVRMVQWHVTPPFIHSPQGAVGWVERMRNPPCPCAALL